MSTQEIHEAVALKVATASSQYSPGFKSVLECMVGARPTTNPHFYDVAIDASNRVLARTKGGVWHTVSDDGVTLTQVDLMERVLYFCMMQRVHPKERFYLMELIRCMKIDGRGLN